MLPLGMLNIWATKPRNTVEIRSAPTRMMATSPTPLKNLREKDRGFSCVAPVLDSSVFSNAIAFLGKTNGPRRRVSPYKRGPSKHPQARFSLILAALPRRPRR